MPMTLAAKQYRNRRNWMSILDSSLNVGCGRLPRHFPGSSRSLIAPCSCTMLKLRFIRGLVAGGVAVAIRVQGERPPRPEPRVISFRT
jgi:hypothetical protein